MRKRFLVTDEVFDLIRRYVDAVPPATEATLDTARQRWEGPTVSLGEFIAAPEDAPSTDLPLLRPEDRRRPGTARQRSLRFSTLVVAACLVAVTLVVGVTIDRHLGSSSVHHNIGAAATPALCSKGPYQLEFTDELSGHGLYPLVAPYQFVVLQPVTGSGVPVTDLRAGPLASVFIWRDGVWNAEKSLPVPAPNSTSRRDPAIVMFTSSYPRGQRYLVQVPFSQPPAATSGAGRRSSLLLCITLVISELTPAVTTTEAG
jgi:hypothetical protein